MYTSHRTRIARSSRVTALAGAVALAGATALAAAATPTASAQSPVTGADYTPDELVTPGEPAFWDLSQVHMNRILSPLGDSVPVHCSWFHSHEFGCTQTAADGTVIELTRKAVWESGFGSLASQSVGSSGEDGAQFLSLFVPRGTPLS